MCMILWFLLFTTSNVIVITASVFELVFLHKVVIRTQSLC